MPTTYETLKQLFPVEMDGFFDADLALEGAAIDDIVERADQLLLELFPQTCSETIHEWERVYGITPNDTLTLQQRRNAVITRIRAKGPSSRQDFIDLADSLGFTITIEEPKPFRAGISKAGDSLGPASIIFCWQVNVSGQGLYRFKAGLSRAGERLTQADQDSIEGIFELLKPAHTNIIWNYI